MPSWKWASCSWFCLSFLSLCLLACGEEEKRSGPESWKGLCIDADKDGFGFECKSGPDCDDSDPTLHTDCGCNVRATGCECDTSTAPIECELPSEHTESGGLLCHKGTRYCRDGFWSECEGIRSFEVPSPGEIASDRARTKRVDQDAAPQYCDPCHPNCYRVDDLLEVVADAGPGQGTAWGPGGGITLSSGMVDAGAAPEGGLLDDTTCTPGVAPDVDCDGIPDAYDPYPSAPPFATDHNTIFMDLPPGSSGDSSFEITFYLNTADIYFYLDMTGSMEGERDNLVYSLTNGNYLPSGGAGTECADRNFDGSTADEEVLKNQGIAGNIACLIRDSKLGAGWFRDIPFPGPNADGTRIAPYDFPMLGNVQDITSDIGAVRDAINTFQTRGNYNVPEGSMQGLWALATGGEVYAGWDRPGIPRRLGCPGGTWGYPCFRDDAVPIIIHITDAPLQNGPDATSTGYLDSGDTPVNYDTATLDEFTAGTEGSYRQLTAGAGENFNNAEFVGTIDDLLVTYIGDTSKMVADTTYEQMGTCPVGQYAWNAADQTSKDAVFRFQVDTPKTLTISARGSQYDTTLLVTRADASTSYGITLDASGNGTTSSAIDLGALSPSGKLAAGVHTSITGNTTGFPENFSRESLACLTSTDADDKEEAAVFKFQLEEDIPLRFSAKGSGFQVTTALIAGKTVEPSDTDLNYIYCSGAPSTVNDDCNNNFGDFNIGDLHAGSITTSLGTKPNNGYVRLINGSLSDESIFMDFPADGFVAGGCNDDSYKVTGTREDAVVDFSLSKETRVRIESFGRTTGSLALGFDHAIALIERPATIAPLEHNPSGNETAAQTAQALYDAEILESEVLGLPPGGWIQYVGNSQTATNNYTRAQLTGGTSVCQTGAAGPTDSLRDVAFKFVVTQTNADGTPLSFDFDTFPTNPQYGYKTWLSVHRGIPDAQISKNLNGIPAAIFDDHDLAGGAGYAALNVTEGALDYRQVILKDMDMRSNDRTLAPNSTTVGLGCGTGASPGGRDALYSFRLDSATDVRIRTTNYLGSLTGEPDFKTFVAVYRNTIDAAGLVSGACSDPGTRAYEVDLTGLPAGNYYVLVKEWSYNSGMSTSTDDYGLIIEDVRYSQAQFIACDQGSHPNSSTYSKLTRTLEPGVYYLVLKGSGSGTASAYHNYQLNVRPTPPNPPIIACAATAGRHNTIELADPLPAGNYSVVIRGLDSDDDRGAYSLSIRDMDLAPDPVGCHNTRAGVPSFTQTLSALDSNGQPIDYYLVMRGNNTAGKYTLAIDDVRSATLACADDNAVPRESGGSPSYLNAEVTEYFEPGEYVAVLKGYDGADNGVFQLSFGDPSLEQKGEFGAKRWLGPSGDGTGGVREALVSRGVRVITVRSSTDSVLRAQADELAKQTGAVNMAGTPLTFGISSDGSGMGYAVIDAVNQLAGNLSMDVGVILREQPDNPNPNFNFKVEALDKPGDSCDPPTNQDGDPEGLPDTHMNCRPGATPRFKITLQNPAPPNNVPTNPNDPNGGWNMKLQLIGDGVYVVDEIPVYIIPEDVVPDPGGLIYESEGNYEEEVKALGCVGNEAPTWKALQWNASLPGGTKVSWQLCGGNTDAELGSCTWKTVATVQPGASCTIPEDCPNGYCDDSGVCHYVQGPTCSKDSECGKNGACVSGACFWTDNTIDLKPALLAGLQGRKRMRVRVVLQANATRTQAPTINDWRLQYTCTAQE